MKNVRKAISEYPSAGTNPFTVGDKQDEYGSH